MPGPKKQIPVALGDALRAELEAGAKERGHSIANEVRRRLDDSYDYDTADPPTRALVDAILHLSTLIRVETRKDWHSHPAANRVMRHAITARLARLRPPGDGEFKPDEMPKIPIFVRDAKNPETIGLDIEHWEFTHPLKKTNAEERREQFEKDKAELLRLQSKSKKGSNK